MGSKNRRYDAALLFLLFPLGVITDETMADLVLHDVSKYLAGEHGIRRYLGDSYWAPDYGHACLKWIEHAISATTSQPETCSFPGLATKRSGVFSIESRPRTTGVAIARRAQSRIARDRSSFQSLACQITDDWRCTELYYLRQSEYVANPHVPLQWTQADLTVAIDALRATIASDGR